MKIAYISTYPPRECGIAMIESKILNACNKCQIFLKV